jgi:hypothetical protein
MELPRLLGISGPWSLAPFGAACLGLSVGVITCASLVEQKGTSIVAAWGTALWGFAVASAGIFLARLNFISILFSLLAGGIGVGWTYLAVVVLVGEAFPNLSLVRSAIGPMGFSSGAAACIMLDFVFNFASLDANSLGVGVTSAGTGFIVVGAATMVLVPSEKRKAPSLLKAQKSESDFFLFVLLFLNALPGMVIFDALLPFASYHTQGTEYNLLQFLAYSMIALFSGGLLAPFLNSKFGPRLTFVVLFCLRGCLLALLSQFKNTTVAIACLLCGLFGHGTGFSILPGLVKAQQEQPASFPSSYGRVLITWGIAGFVGCIMNGVLDASLGDYAAVSLLIGVISFSFGAALYFVPSLGAASLI